MEFSDKLPKIEHAYNAWERKHNRRALMKKRVGMLAAGTLAAVVGFEALATVAKIGRGEAKEPNAFSAGRVEIIMSDNLHVRTSPEKHSVRDGQEDNTVDWDQIEQVKSKGDKWVDVKDGKAIIIEMPAVYKGDESNPKDDWITFDAKVSGGLFGNEEERLYVNFDPNQTGEYVKRLEPGSVYMLGGNSGSDWTGTVTVEK